MKVTKFKSQIKDIIKNMETTIVNLEEKESWVEVFHIKIDKVIDHLYSLELEELFDKDEISKDVINEIAKIELYDIESILDDLYTEIEDDSGYENIVDILEDVKITIEYQDDKFETIDGIISVLAESINTLKTLI